MDVNGTNRPPEGEMAACPEYAPGLGKTGQKISKKRLEANRRNAQKSTGPRTQEGKERSRQNALKHGMTGAGVVIHPGDEEALRTRLEGWTEDLEPDDSVEGWLVGRAALASVRLDRSTRIERAALLDRAEDARTRYDAFERHYAETLAITIDTKPLETVNNLEARAAGCAWLIAEWTALRQSLQERGYWNRNDLTRSLHLLGLSEPPTVASDADVAGYWSLGLALQPALDPEDAEAYLQTSAASDDHRTRVNEARTHLPEPGQAFAYMSTFIEGTIARLEKLKAQVWATFDNPLRQRAVLRSQLDSSDSGERMLGYEKANSAEVHRCLNLLFRKRAAESKSKRRADAESDPRAEGEDRDAVRLERREIAREVVALLKRRKARRVARQAAASNGSLAVTASANAAEYVCENGSSTHAAASRAPEAASTTTSPIPAAQSQSATPVPPFPLPRPLSERLAEPLEAASPATPGAENEATTGHEQPSNAHGSSSSVESSTPSASSPPAQPPAPSAERPAT